MSMNQLETSCIALYLNPENVAYFDSYIVECMSQGIRKFVGNENIVTNIYRIQAHDSIMCGYFCIVMFTIHIENLKN